MVQSLQLLLNELVLMVPLKRTSNVNQQRRRDEENRRLDAHSQALMLMVLKFVTK